MSPGRGRGLSGMPRLRVHNLSVSLDGYAAGPDQSPRDPLGIGGEQLHEWIFAADGAPAHPVDAAVVARSEDGIGATIMGRRMFGPVRGPWPDQSWVGWWGEDPPFHHPVFVLTHHARPPVHMQGGTTFSFVTEGIEAALEQAFASAGGQDVRLGGGVATVQQYLRAGLVDELNLVIVPVLLGGGERLFDHLDGTPAGYECVEFTASPSVAHARLRRSRG